MKSIAKWLKSHLRQPKFSARPDSVKVSIDYTNQMISGATKTIQLPFVVGVLADLHGKHNSRLPPIDERKMRGIAEASFDDVMAALRPKLVFEVPNHLVGEGDIHVELSFEEMDDFGPGAIAEKVADIAAFLEKRDSSSGDLDVMDDRLDRQLNAILHHRDFQQLESAWRGLHFLVSRTETSRMLKIRFLPISKRELFEECSAGDNGAWATGRLYELLYLEDAQCYGGEPFGCLIGDFYFDHSPQDVQILGYLSKIAARAHAPFFAAAAPSLFHMDDWVEISDPHDLDFQAPEYAQWHDLRDQPESRFIGLTMPRYLARATYDAVEIGRKGYMFREQVHDPDIRDFTWANSAYLMGMNITRAFHTYGWCARIRGIESGGEIEGLPTRMGQSDGGEIDPACPMEIAIGARRENELCRVGLMPVFSSKSTDSVAFVTAASLHNPTEHEQIEDTRTAHLWARFPYVFGESRFVHYLTCIARDKCAHFETGQELEAHLNDWIARYVITDRRRMDDAEVVQRPLMAGEVRIKDRIDHENARAMLHYELYYQLEAPPMRTEFQLRLLEH